MNLKVLQRHCIIQMDDTGNTVRDFRFPDLRSPWTQSHSQAMYFMGFLKERHPEYNLEIVSENFEATPAKEFVGAIPRKQKEWIETNVLDTADGLCMEWAGLMCQTFPELQLMYGNVVTHDSRRYIHHEEGHFWCQTSHGVIVDPTANQFGDITSYANGEPATPHGFCEVCGALTYGPEKRCSVYCYLEKEGVEWDEREQWPFIGTGLWNRTD